MNVHVITYEDQLISLGEWQGLYDLSGDQIGKYFRLRERRFSLDLELYGALHVCEPLMYVMDLTRKRWGRPIIVNSFNRNEAKQAELRAAGLRAAVTSPHVVYLAADLDTTSKEETRELAHTLLQAARDLKIKVRIGYTQYLAEGSTFVHVDVCPEYYAPGSPRHEQPHPSAWEIPYLIW